MKRGALLAGVSVAAVLALGLPVSSARAAGNPFSAQWYGQAAVPAGRTASTNPAVAALSPAQQRQVNVSVANVQRAADALRTARVEQATAQSAARSATMARPDGRVVGNGLVRNGLWYARGAVTGDSYDVTTGAARAGAATNGLVWQGADLPTQTSGSDVVSGTDGRLVIAASAGHELVTVKQTTSKSIVTWQNFDVGSNTTYYAQQTSADGTPQRGWTMLNRVVAGAPDASGARVQAAPSLILGKIRSEGEVFLINQNGIIFGAGGDVNTNTIVASSLDIGLPFQTLAERNTYFLTNGSGRTNFSFQYLLETDAARIRDFGRLKLKLDPAASIAGTETINGRDVNSVTYAASIVEDARQGDVVVERGARIVTSPLDKADIPTGLSANNANLGRIVLAGPNVYNAGNLRADDGQIALLGTRNFSFYANDGLSGKAVDSAIRGALIDIGQQDLQAIALASPTTRANSYINSSLSETIFGNATEGSAPVEFPNGLNTPALIVGVAQGGANYDASKPDGSRYQQYTDQKKPYVIKRWFGNASGSATSFVGTVINTGIVDTPRGVVTVRAGSVTQNGLIAATTSVNQAGLIDIQAVNTTSVALIKSGNFLTPVGANRLGSVEFSRGAITSILPDAQVQADGTLKTIPSDALSLANFKSSQIRVGTINSALLPDTIVGSGVDAVYSLAQARAIGNFAYRTTAETLTAGAVSVAAGSMLLAPSGKITITASAPLQQSTTDPTIIDPNRYILPAIFSAGITVGTAAAGGSDTDLAVIDVAGLGDVVLPIESNIITVARIGQNELADSPFQRNGFLYRQKNIRVDRRLNGIREDGVAWQGTPLFDATGYINARGQLVTELMTAGGTIDLSGAVAVGQKALLNIAGGLLTYAAGDVSTTTLVTADGKRTVDIGRASAFDLYSGFAGQTTETSIRFGQSVTYDHLGLASGAGAFEASYFEGGSGGKIVFSGVPQAPIATQSPLPLQALTTGASFVAFDGAINAGAVTGIYQHVGSLFYNPAKGLPTGGMLDLSRVGADTVTIAMAADVNRKRAASPSAFLPTTLAASTVFDSKIFLNQYWSTETLSSSGLAAITLGNAGIGDPIYGQLATKKIAFGSDANPLSTDLSPFSQRTTLNLPDFGSLSLNAQTISIDGSITAHAGRLAFNLVSGRYAKGQFATLSPLAALLPRSSFSLATGSTLDVSGIFVNDTSTSRDSFIGYGAVDGGSISIGGNAYLQTIDLARGSTLNLSSGGYVAPRGRLGTSGRAGLGRGRGGNLTLAIADPIPRSFVTLDPAADPALGYTGSLENVRERIDTRLNLDAEISAFGFQGGGIFKLVAPTINIGRGALGGTGGDIRLNPAFFQGNGFGSFDLTGVLTTRIDDGVQLTLNQKQFLPSASLVSAQTVAGGAVIGQWGVNSLQRTPVNFRLAGLGLTDSTTRLQPATDASGSLIPKFLSSSYAADNALTIGAGAAVLADPGAALSFFANGQLRIGSSSGAPTTIRAAGGSIAITQNFGQVSSFTAGRATPTGTYFYNDDPLAIGVPVSFNTAIIASRTLLDTRGVFLKDAQVFDHTAGTLLDGGMISLGSDHLGRTGLASAQNRFGGQVGAFGGALLVQSGAILDVSGAAATVDVAENGFVRAYSARAIASDAGTVTLNATDLAGSVKGYGGSASSAGATLIVTTDAIGQSVATNVDAVTALAVPMLLAGPNRVMTGGLATDILTNSGIDAVVVNAATRDGTGLPQLSLQQNFGLQVGRSLILNTTRLTHAVRPAAGASVSDVDTLSAPYLRIASPGLSSGNKTGASVDPFSGIGTATESNTSLLMIDGRTIDVAGSFATTGFGTTALQSSGDIRFMPILVPGTSTYDYKAGIVASGDLQLTAAQIYPTTGVNAFLAALTKPGSTAYDSGTITIRGNGAVPVAPLSAGGSLTLSAGTIVQGGVLRAPLGQIALGFTYFPSSGLPPVKTKNVTALAGSLTSVSLDGLTVPYGQTLNGTDWRYSNLSGANLSGPPAKAINVVADGASLEGASNGRAPAIFDLSGGGDIYATEFVPGLGGQRDVLQASLSRNAANAVYAIIPGAQPLVAPIDPQGYSNYAPDTPGRSVTLLTDVAGLKAGTYTLYPGYYATLPGAYRIEAVSGLVDLGSAQTIDLIDGSVIAAGVTGVTGTNIASSRTSGFRISASAIWRQYSQIDLSTGNRFFSDLATKSGVVASPLPVDAGRLSLSITATDQALRTAANIRFGTGLNGRGGQVDIATARIAIVSDALLASYGAALKNTLLLTPTQLRNFNATSILLGGTRATDFGGDHISLTATDIRVATTAADPLSNPELILATGGGATDPFDSSYNRFTSITVEAGSVIKAAGASATGGAPAIELGLKNSPQAGIFDGQSGDGAFLRVSANNPVVVTRLNPSLNPVGLVDIRSTAATPTQVDGGQSLQIDGSGGVNLNLSALLGGKAVALASNRIVFSNAAGQTGTTIGPATLRLLANAESLNFAARDRLIVDAPLAIAAAAGAPRLTRLTFDVPTLVATGLKGGALSLDATNVTLANSTTAAAASPLAGDGRLIVTADHLRLSGHDRSTQGFGAFDFTASRDLTLGDAALFGTLSLPGALSVVTPLVILGGGSDQTIVTRGAASFTIGSGQVAGGTPGSDVSGKFVLDAGGDVTVATAFSAQNGDLSFRSRSGNLTLGAAAAIDATGFTQSFLDKDIVLGGGKVGFFADTGNGIVAAGAKVDVSADPRGNAGLIQIVTSGKGSQFAITDGFTGASNGVGQGGSFVLDSGGAVILDPLARTLMAGGFTSQVSIASAIGNLDLTTTNLTAHAVSLVADDRTSGGGLVTVATTIDASGAEGGTIDLTGQQGVRLASGAKLLARATKAAVDGAGGRGGVVTIGTGVQTPDTQVQSAGGSIRLAAGSLIDVSDAAGYSSSQSSSGASVHVRAPIIAGGVDVVLGSGVTGARTFTLEGYRRFTTQNSAFDGIIDPAGWFGYNVATGKAEYVQGTWRDAYGGIVPAGDPQRGIAVPTTFTEASYFSPSYYDATGQLIQNANQAHVGFYQGTLVDFVQRPGVNLAGFANVSGLVFRPGIELVNSDRARLGGDIQVLSNWNLGAGSGLDSLYYRTATGSQPGLLTVRAMGDIVVKASISDGFFRTNAVSAFPGFTFADARNVFDNNVYGSPSLGQPRQLAQLGIASGGVETPSANQYYRLYEYYTKRLRAYQTLYINNVGPSSQPYTQVQTGPYITADPSTNYSAYTVQYQSYLEEVKKIDLDVQKSGSEKYKRPIAPVAPLTDADYGNYGQNYLAYAAFSADFLYTLTSNAVSIAGPAAPRGTLSTDRDLIAFNRSVANDIANNATAGDPQAVTSAQLRTSGNSWSYQFTSGAATSSAAVTRFAGRDTTTGSFTIGSSVLTAAMPAGSGNIIRTGNAEIGIAARGSVQWANANDVIYTAGIDAGVKPGFVDTAAYRSSTPVNEAQAFIYGQSNNGGAFATAGGDIRVTALGNIVGAPAKGNLLSVFRRPVFSADSQDNTALGIGSEFSSNGTSFFAPNDRALRSVDWWLSNQGAVGANPGTDGVFGGQSLGTTLTGQPLLLPGLQSAEWVTTGRISGSLAAVGGGNISVSSGGSIAGLSVAVVSTFEASGGKRSADPGSTTIPAVTIARFGGGNISIQSRGDISGLTLLNARGVSTVEAGGALSTLTQSVRATDFGSGNNTDAVNYLGSGGPNGGDLTPFSFVPFDLTTIIQPSTIMQAVETGNNFIVENGQLNVSARGGITIAALADNGAQNRLRDLLIGASPSATTPIQNAPFSQLGDRSSASFVAATGDVVFSGIRPIVDGRSVSNDPYRLVRDGIQMPSRLMLASLNGDLTINDSIDLAPSATGNLDLLARGSIYYNSGIPTVGALIRMDDRSSQQVASILRPQVGVNLPLLDATALHAPTVLPLHYGDAEQSRIIALTGDIATGPGLGSAPVPNFTDPGQFRVRGSVTALAEPVAVFAGRDIVDMQLFGQNVSSDSLTSVTAGRDITYTFTAADPQGFVAGTVPIGGSYTLGGSGRLALIAGRSLSLSPSIAPISNSRGEIIVAAQDRGALTVGNDINPYLPRIGSDIDLLFGVGPSVGLPGNASVQKFVDIYLNPAKAGALQTDYGDVLRAFVNDRLTKKAREIDPATGFVSGLSVAEAYAALISLSPSDQRALADQVLFNEIRIVADPSDPTQYQNFARAYRAIDALFPAALGYTDNFASPLRIARTGNFDMVSSLVRTNYGGGVNILGPGGNATIGGLAIDARSQGVLTLRGGDINIFLDGNLAVNSSRVFTLQGGDETIFTTNGNIDAGRGKRTAAFLPPLLVNFLPNSTGIVNFGGLVTGAGIGTLQTLPSSVPSDVFLLAPRGDIDAGDAGIRASRNLFVVANRVFNADNIAVGGKSVGVPQAPIVAGSSVAAASQAGAGAQAGGTADRPRQIDPQAIITVQVTGFGADDDEEKRRKRDRR